MALTSRKKQALDQKIRTQMVNLHKNPDSVNLIEKFRWLCLEKFGARGFKQLASLFKRLDKSNDGQIDEKEFVNGIQSLYLRNLSTKEIKQLYRELDSDCSGSVSLKEFNEKLIADFLPGNRRDQVEKLFKTIDYDHSGYIEKDDLMKKFNFSSNLSYKSGQSTKEQCMEEFISSFEDDAHNSEESDGKISFQEFLSYYAGISLAVEDDSYFMLELQKNWKSLSTTSERQRSWPVSDSFALDLSKSSSANIRPSPHRKTDVKPLSQKSITDRQTQSARTLKSYQIREYNNSSGTISNPRATVVFGNKRSLYKTVAPSFVDRHLFGKPRNQQLMESDWPKFKSPFSQSDVSKSLDCSTPLKWSPPSPETVKSNLDSSCVEKNGLNISGGLRTTNGLRKSRSLSAQPYRTHKVTLAIPDLAAYNSTTMIAV